jgi:hypothetical protein
MDSPASRKTGFVHTVRKDGVEFKLCLLNEQGEPAVVFREGENFSFRFEMENLREGDKRTYPAALRCILRDIVGLGNIFTPENELAYSVSRIMCTDIGATCPFDGENRFVMSFDLQDASDPETDPPVALPKGAYTTGFTYTFRYRIPPVRDGKDINAIPPDGTRVEVGPVSMNIDFTVE